MSQPANQLGKQAWRRGRVYAVGGCVGMANVNVSGVNIAAVEPTGLTLSASF